MRISLIAALSENRVIGVGNRLPWRLPDDLKRFKKLTWGHPLIVGRKTYESIGKPLPGRKMIVLTAQPDFRLPPGVLLADSLDKAFRLAAPAPEVFVGGGAKVYRQALPLAERLYLTLVRALLEGDHFFPIVDWSEWQLIQQEEHAADARHAFPFSFVVYQRATAR